jgi:uncharacterized protein (TIGR03435 family)
MHKFGDVLKLRKKFTLNALRLAAVVTIMFGVATVALTHAQAQPQTQNTSATTLPKFEYEVASIKPDLSDHSSASINYPDDGFAFTNTSMKGLILNAYGILDFQILGAPDWLGSELYVIDAKMDAATMEALKKLSSENKSIARRQMLQTLLADRLKLTIHRETREFPVYFLVIAKNGSKLQHAKPNDTYANGVKGRGDVMGPGMSTSSTPFSSSITAQGIPISTLLSSLARPLGRPVLDKTGLSGNFDFTLKFATARPGPDETLNGRPWPDSDLPFLFEAIQQQLGLKLESGKGPVEVIVIDHVERPSGN